MNKRKRMAVLKHRRKYQKFEHKRRGVASAVRSAKK